MQPRCLDCGYILSGLDTARCPECGRPFDLRDSTSYSTKPLFNRWRFWLPGFLLALGAGALLYPLLIYYTGFRWTVTLLIPLCLGTLIGYGCRVSRGLQGMLGLIVLCALVFGLFSGNMVGIYCGLVLGAVALGPMMVGIFFGAVLRVILKSSSWEQRWHLPTLLLLVVPLLAGAIEAHYERPYPDETVYSTVVMSVPADRAWNAVTFCTRIFANVRRC